MRLQIASTNPTSTIRPIAVIDVSLGWRMLLAPVKLVALLALLLVARVAAMPAAGQTAATPQAVAGVRVVGTVVAVAGKTVTVKTDAGLEVTVTATEDTKIVRVAPGQKDLKQATPIALADLQPGDRVLIRASKADDGKSLTAQSMIAMAKTDVAAKQAQDREEWQKHGLGGIVTAVDPSASTVTISVTAKGQKKPVLVNIGTNTLLRRYAPDSVKFDDAKPAGLDKVQVGDQLRARGTRSADEGALAADEIVSGTFRNISGTISSIDAAAGTFVVQDLATKKPVTVKITSDSQLRKLTPPVAQRIAARMKGENPSTAGQANGAAQPTSAAAAPSQQGNAGATPSAASATGAPAGSGVPTRGAGAQGGDLQQMLGRMPAASLSDLQKGDAVMIVTTEGTSGGPVTAITLLAGVEPILQALPKGENSSLLSAWSLGGGPAGGDSGTP